MDLLSTAQQTLRHYLVARGATSTVVKLNGDPVHQLVMRGKGPGPPVLLVHGLGGSAIGYCRIFFALLRRFRSVHALDLPGHGFSPTAAAGPLPVWELYDYLERYAVQVVKERSLVVGNSLGGAMSLVLAHRQPSAVQALALICPAGARMTQGAFDKLHRSMNVTTTFDAMALTRRIFHRLPVGWLLLSSELKKMYGTPAVREVFRALTPDDCVAPEVLQSLRMPVLLLWGRSDRLLPADGFDYFRAHLPPHAMIEMVKGFGHVPQMERPIQVVRRLIRFADEAHL